MTVCAFAAPVAVNASFATFNASGAGIDVGTGVGVAVGAGSPVADGGAVAEPPLQPAASASSASTAPAGEIGMMARRFMDGSVLSRRRTI